MKLGTIVNGQRDGELVVISKDGSRYLSAKPVARNLQAALDDWDACHAQLMQLASDLESDPAIGSSTSQVSWHSPLPRAYQWLDGSAYVNHIELVRKARGAEMPDSFWTNPLMYQGGSDAFLGPNDDIVALDEAWGIDLEAEVAVVTSDVPMGVDVADAAQYIKLLMLVNDVSLRNLIPGELAKGFGFVQSKPSTAFAPFAVTPEALGESWSDCKLHLAVNSYVNDQTVGSPNAGIDMTFNFAQLIAHAAKSRPLSAGTIIGSGTVSNYDRSNGSGCLAEVRTLEAIAKGAPDTPFLQNNDRVTMNVFKNDENIFGDINQLVVIEPEK